MYANVLLQYCFTSFYFLFVTKMRQRNYISTHGQTCTIEDNPEKAATENGEVPWFYIPVAVCWKVTLIKKQCKLQSQESNVVLKYRV